MLPILASKERHMCLEVVPSPWSLWTKASLGRRPVGMERTTGSYKRSWSRAAMPMLHCYLLREVWPKIPRRVVVSH